MLSTNLLPIVLTQLLFVVPTLVILIAGIVYVVRTKALEGVLCVVGQGLILIGHVLSTAFTLAMTQGTLAHSELARWGAFIKVPYFLGAVVFAVGFLMIALKQRPPFPPARMPPVTG